MALAAQQWLRGFVALCLWLAGAAAVDASPLRVDALDPALNALELVEVQARGEGWSQQPQALRRSSGSQWWRVQITDPQATADPANWILSLREAYDARLVAYLPPDYRPRPLHLFDSTLQQPGSRHRLALSIDAEQRAQPIYLRIEWSRFQPIQLNAQPEALYLAEDLNRVRFSTAVLATQLLLALVGVLFALALRRRVLALFCLWVVSAMVYHLVMSGEVVAILGRLVERVSPMALSGGMVHLGLLSAYVFVYRFLSIDQHFPRTARVFRGLLWSALILTLLTVFSAAAPIAAQLINVVILMLALLALGLAFRLAIRGSEQACFYLVGWGLVAGVAIVRAGYFLSLQGTPPWLEYLHPAMDALGAFVLVLAVARAARYAEREMQTARTDARTDPLTGLPNRAELDSSLPGRIAEAERSGRALSLMFIDLDHFKHVNDRWGHDVGDLCLAAAAEAMRLHVRSTDLMTRYGGEEFVLVLDGADLAVAESVAAELRAGVERQGRRIGEHTVGLTVSIGIAERQPGEGAGELLRRADEALYRAKAEGRNRYVAAPKAA
ncbi:MAG: GGDEF domain-containing protein [Aquimonas sp.]|nr:GGDEF domain-containing protein [Aquimonas sp.]